MDRAKYIIFAHPMLEVPVVFPMHISHADMAKLIQMEPISAGFARLADGELETFGDSLTLKLKARPEDTRLLQSILGLRK